MAKLQADAAELWQTILRTDPIVAFGDQAARLQRRNASDEIAQPGYVGGGYRPGGLVFVGMNPGGGGDGLGTADRAQYQALTALRDAAPDQTPAAFAQLTTVLERIMPTWRIFGTFVAPVLRGAKMAFPDVAYLNLLKWRTKSSGSLTKLYDASWRLHTSEQFALLSPAFAVAVGADAGRYLERHPLPAVEVCVIPRVIGNNIDARGRQAIEDACTRLLRTT